MPRKAEFTDSPLTIEEREFATENHNLIYSFLRRYGYNMENYYDVAVFGFLKAVQVYNRREDLRKKYDFPFISWQYMRSEIGNNFKVGNSKKRKPVEIVVSLDADSLEKDGLYNCIGENSLESEILDTELLTEFLDNLSDNQRRIAEMRIDGYSNKETYLTLKIKPSTYYMELKRIKATLEKLTG